MNSISFVVVLQCFLAVYFSDCFVAGAENVRRQVSKPNTTGKRSSRIIFLGDYDNLEPLLPVPTFSTNRLVVPTSAPRTRRPSRRPSSRPFPRGQKEPPSKPSSSSRPATNPRPPSTPIKSTKPPTRVTTPVKTKVTGTTSLPKSVNRPPPVKVRPAEEENEDLDAVMDGSGFYVPFRKKNKQLKNTPVSSV